MPQPASQDRTNGPRANLIALAGALACLAVTGLALALAGLRGSALDWAVWVVAIAGASTVGFMVWIAMRPWSGNDRDAANPAPRAFDGDPIRIVEDRLRTALSRAARNQGSVSILAIEADQYAECRNGLGDAVAEALEAAIVSRIGAVLRAEEMILRVGPNRYMAVLYDTGAGTPQLVIARIREQFAPILTLAGERFAVTLSVGAARNDIGSGQPGALIRSAEIALAEAVARGGGGTVYYSEELDDITQARAMIARGLRGALARGDELALVFQPVWDLSSGEMTGAETLLRWNHAIHGRLSASFLISLAEDEGLIERLSHWAFDTGTGPVTAARLPVAGFNLSVGQLESRRVVGHLCALASRDSSSPLRIEADFPLHALDRPLAMDGLERLHGAGIGLCVDGMGDNPAAALKQIIALRRERGFDVDTVKIDLRGFPALGQSAGDWAQLFDIAVRLRGAGIAVAAKSVETASQIEQLKALGITQVQGNFLCAPVTGTTLIRMAQSKWAATGTG